MKATALNDPPPEPAEPWLSVVLPCFNEAEVIAETHRRVTAVCAGRRQVLRINCGQRRFADGTLVKLGNCPGRILLLWSSTSRATMGTSSRSQPACISRGQRILIMDADLQDPPELLPDMLQKWTPAWMWSMPSAAPGLAMRFVETQFFVRSITGCCAGWRTRTSRSIPAISGSSADGCVT